MEVEHRMSDPLILLKNVERLGETYRDKYLTTWDSDKLNSDWWEALKFFFNHSFPRGRRDTLSNEYYCFTIDRLQKDILKTENPDDEAYRTLQQHLPDFDSHIVSEFKKRHQLGKTTAMNYKPWFSEEVANQHPIIRLLTSPKQVEVKWESEQPYSKEVRLGNDEDVMMVLDTLKFICDERRRNIYSYIKHVIQEQGIRAIYRELDDLHGVGDKIASLVIRDIGLLNPGLIQGDYEYAFPVDTWVGTVTKKIRCTAEDGKGIKQYFIQRCKEESLDPPLVAAGLWHLGSHSLDILLDNYLGKYELPKRV
jgi:hypothetical protein